MARLALGGVIAVLAAALVTACLGGQTGQPDSASVDCNSMQLDAAASWSGTTVEAAANAFAGTYTAKLSWQTEPRSAVAHTPVAFEDTAQLGIAYEQVAAIQGCGSALIVPMSITFTTSHSGISDSGAGTLTITRSPQALVGTLHYESKLLRLDATLDEAALAHAPRGAFDALDPTLPGASAIFTENP